MAGEPSADAVAAGILHGYYASRIIIANQETFETGRANLIYLDYRRNILRDLFRAVIRHVVRDNSGLAGKKYRIGGETGRVLYQLTQEDYADPEV